MAGRQWVKSGELKATGGPAKQYVDRADLDALIEKMKAGR